MRDKYIRRSDSLKIGDFDMEKVPVVGKYYKI